MPIICSHWAGGGAFLCAPWNKSVSFCSIGNLNLNVLWVTLSFLIYLSCVMQKHSKSPSVCFQLSDQRTPGPEVYRHDQRTAKCKIVLHLHWFSTEILVVTPLNFRFTFGLNFFLTKSRKIDLPGWGGAQNRFWLDLPRPKWLLIRRGALEDRCALEVRSKPPLIRRVPDHCSD